MSLALEALMIWMLIITGVIPVSSANPKERILLMDLVSPAHSEAGAVSTKASTSSNPTAAPTELDVAAASDSRSEWSMTKLPPLPPTTAAAPAAEAARSGEANVGQAAGAGFDPYSFASYQPALVERLISGTALRANQDALASLQQALRQRLVERGIAMKLQLTVARDGRVVRAEVVSDLSPASRAVVQATMQGSPLFPADPARPNEVRTTLSLNV